MQLSIHQAINSLWMATGAVWAITALRVRPATRIQSPRSRTLHLVLMGKVFALLFDSRLRIGPLGTRVLRASDITRYCGFVLTLAGVSFAIWARLCLGENWSA